MKGKNPIKTSKIANTCNKLEFFEGAWLSGFKLNLIMRYNSEQRIMVR